MRSGSAQQYPTMTTEQIAALPVQDVVADESVCFLWAPTPLGVDPYRVLEAWGYRFTTKWYWHKTQRLGMGFWTRGVVEEVLIGIRGKVKAWRSPLTNWLEEGDELVLHETPRAHSAKPEQVQARIELLIPETPRLELFATRVRPGWVCVGSAIDPGHDLSRPEVWDVIKLSGWGDSVQPTSLAPQG